ncbi:MAG: ester cyclase [Solirubrobacterales bacterium]|nr:ester cyclase [Solirubrobacterales bacterium]
MRRTEVLRIEEHKATVARFDELTGASELDALDEICTADMVNHALASHRPAGLAGTKQFLAESERDPGKAAWRRSMMFDQRVVTVAEGEYVIQLGKRAGTWPGGRFRGIDIPAGEYEYGVAFMYRFSDGRIAERWAVRDDLGMILQLTPHHCKPSSTVLRVRQHHDA